MKNDSEIKSTFLKEIIANPDDDGPRLVYADWLMEHGDQRGDFIIAQCTLMSDIEESAKRLELRRQTKRLLTKYEKIWTQPLGLSNQHPSNVTYRFKRGFIEEIDTDSKQFVERSDIIYSLEPVQSLKLAKCDTKTFEILDKSDWVSILNALKMRGKVPQKSFTQFVRNERFSNLKILNLGECGLSDNHLKKLAQSEVFRNLRSLSLSGNKITDKGLIEFAKTHNFSKLESLYLSRNDIGDDGIIEISKSPLFSSLKTLSVNWNEKITKKSVKKLIESDLLKDTRRLEIEGVEITSPLKEKAKKRFHVLRVR